MLRRLVRFVVATALGLALWMACAPSARAATSERNVGAPMCDVHAASVNAPAPTLETPQSATEIGMSPEAAATLCDALPGLQARFPGRVHRAAPREAVEAGDSACDLPPSAFLPPRLSARLRGSVRTDGARDGTRSALERPPRRV